MISEIAKLNNSTVAIAGTHGKTTTSSLITSILKFSKLNPSYLIGGMPIGLDAPAKYTKSDYFVIEADEYDTSFLRCLFRLLQKAFSSFCLLPS